MDLGTVSSDDVIASYARQLADASRTIAMLEGALERERRAAALARIATTNNTPMDPGPDDVDPERVAT